MKSKFIPDHNILNKLMLLYISSQQHKEVSMTTFTRILVTLAAFAWQIILHSNAFITSSDRITPRAHVTPVILASSGSGAHLINDDLYRHIIENCVNDDIDRMYATYSSFYTSLNLK